MFLSGSEQNSGGAKGEGGHEGNGDEKARCAVHLAIFSHYSPSKVYHKIQRKLKMPKPVQLSKLRLKPTRLLVLRELPKRRLSERVDLLPITWLARRHQLQQPRQLRHRFRRASQGKTLRRLGCRFVCRLEVNHTPLRSQVMLVSPSWCL